MLGGYLLMSIQEQPSIFRFLLSKLLMYKRSHEKFGIMNLFSSKYPFSDAIFTFDELGSLLIKMLKNASSIKISICTYIALTAPPDSTANVLQNYPSHPYSLMCRAGRTRSTDPENLESRKYGCPIQIPR